MACDVYFCPTLKICAGPDGLTKLGNTKTCFSKLSIACAEPLICGNPIPLNSFTFPSVILSSSMAFLTDDEFFNA